jgi:hypothetical protein
MTQPQPLTKTSKVQENILSMISGQDSSPENPFKSLTVRLSVKDYAKLSVLASRLNQSPSGLGKTILLSGLSDSFAAYLSVKDEAEELALAVDEESIRIFEDLL